jgi:hypothetical protein
MPTEVVKAITASPQEGRKQEALMAERLNPGWAVVWGAYYRVFTAWAMWGQTQICHLTDQTGPAPHPICMEAVMTLTEVSSSVNQKTPFGLLRQITVPEALATGIPGIGYDYERALNTLNGEPIDPVVLGTWTTTYDTPNRDNKSDEESK